MQITETPVDLTRLPEQARNAIQKRADEWGVSFDDACLRMLLEHSRALQAQRSQPRDGLLSRLFRRGPAQ